MRRFNSTRGYDFYRDTGVLWRDGYAQNKLTAEVLSGVLEERLREIGEETRFFAHMVFVDVHSPWVTSEVGDGWRARGAAAGYDQQIHYLDHFVGEMLARVVAMRGDDLLVIVTADHGEGFGSIHPGDVHHGTQLYNSTLWVPLIFHHPMLEAAPRRIQERVELVDITPTVLDLLGIPSAPGAFEGLSLAAAVLGAPAPLRARSVVETAYDVAFKSAILEGGYKLIVDYNSPRPASFELYRFETDPLERTNLAGRSADRAGLLYRHLVEWQRAHPARTTGPVRSEISEREALQLRALGYATD